MGRVVRVRSVELGSDWTRARIVLGVVVAIG